jgi:ribosome maturation factor RimP
MKKPDLENLKKELSSTVESAGFELAEMAAPIIGGRLTLRLFIHSPAGVTLDDCAAVSRLVSERLDGEDPVTGRYTLEVSSLGLDRPLLTARDFQRRIGESVKVTYMDNGNKKTVAGILKNVVGNMIEIEDEDEITSIPVEANPRGKIVI